MKYQVDSRKVNPGDTFICLPGAEPYIEEAQRRGCGDVVKLTRKELADYANAQFGHPSKKLTVIGITGTNGKTTVSYLVHHTLQKLKNTSSHLQGTLTSYLTMPESIFTIQDMAQHLQNGGTHYVMEVSSHGIHQHREQGIDFAVKALTNISQDHLDYHHTFEEYKQVKLSFLNNAPHCIRPEDYAKEVLQFTPQLLGEYNIDNLKCAQLILKKCQISEADINTYLPTIPAPPGRFEPVEGVFPFKVIVDFAHTPDALENVMKTAKKILDTGRLITVFGCGGNRDATKRPIMGRIAETLSDTVIVTSDNPRFEDPHGIVEDVLKGLAHPQNAIVEVDRRAAIHKAIQIAKPGDMIILAGKGHETTQITKDIKEVFNDKDVAKEALKKYGYLH